MQIPFLLKTFFQDDVILEALGVSITSVPNGDFQHQNAQKTKAVPETTHKIEAKNVIKLRDLITSYFPK